MMQWKQFLLPVVNMDADKAKDFIRAHREGTYSLLDVRQPTEYEGQHLSGAMLIPLPELLDRMGELDPDKPTIVY